MCVLKKAIVSAPLMAIDRLLDKGGKELSKKSINGYSRIGLKLLVTMGGTELLIMTIFRLIRIETWISLPLVDLADTLLLCVVASFLILYWVVKPMKILEEHEKAKEAIASVARFPEENPAPVMRFSSDGTILYANSASLPLRKLWHSELGQKVPADIANSVKDVCDSSLSNEVEVVCGDTIFSLILKCIKNAQYINVYGRDITKRKQEEDALQERIKELGCINNISRLSNEPWISSEEFVQQAVGLLSSAWRYPEICAARIMLNSKEFKTANFRETEWSQSADILVDREKIGAITICYLEEKPTADEGPFSREERSFINTIADFLGHIIQHRLSEAKIRASEEKFRIIFDNATDGILLADTESKKFHFANVTICRMLGYSQEEIKNMGVMDIHPEKDLPYVIEQFEKQSREEIKVAQDLPMKRKDGSVFYADVNSARVEISGKRYLLGIFIDTTERKQAEEEIHKEQAFSEAMLDSLPGIFYLFDHTGRFLRWNRAFETISGYSAEEIATMSPLDFFIEDDRTLLDERIRKVFETGAAEVDAAFVSKDGRRTPYYLVGVRFVLNGAPCCIGMGTDITERKHLEAQLLHAQKMEAVGTLAGGIAHDFNNILNVIMGYGTMVMGTLAADSQSKKDMKEVLLAADRAADLTKRLLIFSRKQVVEVKSVNINELILGLQKMLVRIIRENIDFHLDLADRPMIVQVDAGQIEQVLINLAANARDAMPESGRLTIGTGLEEVDEEHAAIYGYGKPGRYALITVADTGQGMDAETQKKIFEPFFTTKGVGEGTGLGLAISYGIIKQHSGYIKVSSEPGHGTVFKIYLPLSEAVAPLDTKTEGVVAVKGGNETILVAEDDATLRKLTEIVLESFGYTVISAEDGEEAITKFMENRDHISLAVLDMIMPKKNGKEVSVAIRKVCPKIKILFASGYTMDLVTTKELTEDGSGFIQKPFPSKVLLAKVREILDR